MIVSTKPSFGGSNEQIRRVIFESNSHNNRMGNMLLRLRTANLPPASDFARDSANEFIKMIGRRGQASRWSMTSHTSHQSQKTVGTLTSYPLSEDETDEMRGFTSSASTSSAFHSPDAAYYEKSVVNLTQVEELDDRSSLNNKVTTAHRGNSRNYAEWPSSTMAAPSESRRVTASRPLICPDGTSQRSSSGESKTEDDRYDEHTETLYQNATWQMYYRITASRQQAMQKSTSTAASPARHSPSINRSENYDYFSQEYRQHVDNDATFRHPPLDNEGLLIFDMDP